MPTPPPIRIATRTSPLALWQAEFVRRHLRRRHPQRPITLLKLISEGDKTLDTPLAVAGGKGLFMKELEQALLDDRADLAVHSMKDVPAALPAGLNISAICRRAAPWDCVVGDRALADLPPGARVGTCSLRRQSQLRACYPRLHFADLRGNVGTRLARLAAGDYDAIVLAAAGLARLQLEHRIRETLPAETCLPAAGQGAIGIESRTDDAATAALIAPLNHAATATCVTAERTVIARLGGGCQSPIAVFAEETAGGFSLRSVVATVDGTRLIRAEKTGAVGESEAIAESVADDLLAHGAAEILAAAAVVTG